VLGKCNEAYYQTPPSEKQAITGVGVKFFFLQVSFSPSRTFSFRFWVIRNVLETGAERKKYSEEKLKRFKRRVGFNVVFFSPWDELKKIKEGAPGRIQKNKSVRINTNKRRLKVKEE